ncbi:unnamed protein product [Symbiodinium natans]|uniref:Uncharacterized protein n=1 Tax=Symbiodinium natans TaxID=878477 RepID=A0A812QTL7_9DINO|nr:unnamed protein product [Symbiodinium natans]
MGLAHKATHYFASCEHHGWALLHLLNRVYCIPKIANQASQDQTLSLILHVCRGLALDECRGMLKGMRFETCGPGLLRQLIGIMIRSFELFHGLPFSQKAFPKNVYGVQFSPCALDHCCEIIFVSRVSNCCVDSGEEVWSCKLRPPFLHGTLQPSFKVYIKVVPVAYIAPNFGKACPKGRQYTTALWPKEPDSR